MARKNVPLIHAKKVSRKDVVLDSQGFFVVELDRSQGTIRVEYYTNVYKEKKIVSGTLQKVFTGRKADALCDTIAQHVPPLRPEHYLYLGRELQRAQESLDDGNTYIQGGC